ncbi:hypothetical protein ACOSQ4_016889 [Xanthoceras sorbifolium]
MWTIRSSPHQSIWIGTKHSLVTINHGNRWLSGCTCPKLTVPFSCSSPVVKSKGPILSWGVKLHPAPSLGASNQLDRTRKLTRHRYSVSPLLGALAKTNPISAITFSITMFSYAGIPPLAGFCSKFYFFFAALGCGAYFLAPVGVVTSVIGCWTAGRLPRVSQFGGPKVVLHAPDT